MARPVRTSHWATDAFRLPVTGSSTVAPSLGKKARSSNASGAPGAVRPDDAEVEVDEPRPHREHGLGGLEHDRDPARPVVGPLGGDDRGALDVQDRRDVRQELLLHRPRAEQWGCCKCQPVCCPRIGTSPASHSWTSAGIGGGRSGCFEPGVTRAERRVAGERQLQDGREDPDAVVGRGVRRRQDEGRLRQVRPAREPLHLLGGEALGVEHDGDGIPM